MPTACYYVIMTTTKIRRYLICEPKTRKTVIAIKWNDHYYYYLFKELDAGKSDKMLSKLELQSNQKSLISSKILCRLLRILTIFLECVFVFFVICSIILLLATRSPLHLIYNRIDPAGPGSVYVQGKLKY
jgi:hypothetical protein